MKYFEKDGKYNFVDENNVFLGYNEAPSGCEQTGWFLANVPTMGLLGEDNRVLDWKEYEFDTEFFREEDSAVGLDEGGMAIFRLKKREGWGQDKYLHLYNFQNGYYGHGFEFKIGDETKHNGCL